MFRQNSLGSEDFLHLLVSLGELFATRGYELFGLAQLVRQGVDGEVTALHLLRKCLELSDGFFVGQGKRG